MKNYIGVLGGLGTEATILAYRKLHQLYQKRLGSTHTCPIKIVSVDFHSINVLLPNRMSEAAQALLPHILELKKTGVCVQIMINNTLHEAYDLLDLPHPDEVPFAHVGKLLAAHVEKLDSPNTVILGTKYTMRSDYLSSHIADKTKLITLPQPLQEKLEKLRKIYVTGENPDLAEHCINAIEDLSVDKVIIACTELSLAFDQFETSNWVDTIDLQCIFAVDKLLQYQKTMK